MSGLHQDNRLLAIGSILAGVGLASTQDAIVKAMSGEFSAYEATIFRCLGSVPVLAVLLLRQCGLRAMVTPLLGRIMLRAAVLCVAYFAFLMAIAAMPIANTVAIYFTMPFFVAGLAAPVLGERVRLHRWLSIIAGFIGVLIMVRPGAGVFEPAAIFALLSALGYAYGQMIGRPVAREVPPIVIANWQNFAYLAVSLVLALVFNSFDFSGLTHKSLIFLSRPWVWPPLTDAFLMLTTGVLAAAAMPLFIAAYKYAESNFVAPFEYSAMIWAVLYGLLLFGDFPDTYTWLGAAVVVAAGILMLWRDRQLDRASA